MKKKLLVIALMCGALAMSAQNTVNNGGFENWTSGSAVNQQPTGWTTGLIGNIMVDFLGQQVPIPINTYFGSKSTDAHTGSAALKLNPDSIGISMLGIGYPFPSVAQLGEASGFNIPLSTIMSVVDLIGAISSGDTSGLDVDDIDFESNNIIVRKTVTVDRDGDLTIKEGAKIIMCGDHGQLPPIGFGNIFGDLLLKTKDFEIFQNLLQL